MPADNIGTTSDVLRRLSPPSSPSSQSLRPHHSSASFSSLPPELKRAIAGHLYKLLGRELEALRADERASSGLSAFSLVDREALNLSWRSCTSLHFFLREILPRHSALVQVILHEPEAVVEIDELDTPDEGFRDEAEQDLIETVEQIGDVAPESSMLFRGLRIVDLLACEIILLCPNVRCGTVGNLTPSNFGLGEEWDNKWQFYAFQALPARILLVRGLNLMVNRSHKESIKLNKQLLINTASELKKLTVQDELSEGEEESAEPNEYREFWSVLASLENLENLIFGLSQHTSTVRKVEMDERTRQRWMDDAAIETLSSRAEELGIKFVERERDLDV
ncbi:hypothetical protein JCM8547_002849 [Rhodosporidiobolus lusitaniae]